MTWHKATSKQPKLNWTYVMSSQSCSGKFNIEIKLMCSRPRVEKWFQNTFVLLKEFYWELLVRKEFILSSDNDLNVMVLFIFQDTTLRRHEFEYAMVQFLEFFLIFLDGSVFILSCILFALKMKYWRFSFAFNSTLRGSTHSMLFSCSN